MKKRFVLLFGIVFAVLILAGCSNSDTKPPVYVPTTYVSLTNLTADGSDMPDGSSATTRLTLTFDKDIDGLSADDITLDAGSTGAVKGALNRTGTGVYDLALSGITESGRVTVSVSKSGYYFNYIRSSEQVYRSPITALFTGLAADGSATVTTTKLTLTFDKDIDDLSRWGDITLDAGSTGARGESFTRTGTGVYELTLRDITKGGTVTVTVSKSGYAISGGPKTAVIYVTASFTGLTANGSFSETTTYLFLTFDKYIDGLNADDITLDAGSTGASKGTLTRDYWNDYYKLALSGITASGTVTVSVSRSGYSILGGSKQVQVYYDTAGGNSIIVPFVGPAERIISIDRTINNNLSKSNYGSVTLTITENFNNYEWFTGGTKLATGKSVTLYAGNSALVTGYNWITAVVYTGTGAGAVPWSGEFVILVNE